MRIAFYAPMKPFDSPVPSGDRQMARNLVRALEAAGHDVFVPSRFVSRDPSGDAARQKRIAALGAKLADRLTRRWRGASAAPDAWFTYHVYHKSPDWLGPRIRRKTGIPYFIAEASHAPKQSGGRWDEGYRGAEAAIRAADGIVGLSSLDAHCVLPLLEDAGRYHRLAPFTDTGPFLAAARRRVRPPDAPRLLAVGMMRRGDKLASYRLLACALRRAADRPWSLTIAGDGPARNDVAAAFASCPRSRIRWTGAVAPNRLPELYAAADVLAWPAINEAYGMALLEAQATGLPVVAGRSGGVPDIVRDGETGLLTEPGDAAAFAAALRTLLADPDRRRKMAQAALRGTRERHDLKAAAARLDGILRAA